MWPILALSTSFLFLGGSEAFATNPFTNSRSRSRVKRSNIQLQDVGDTITDPLTTDEEIHREPALAATRAPSTALDLDHPTASEPNLPSQILATDSQFQKSLPDRRSYRAISLARNSLTVLLASDPETDVEAASMHVRAGHFDDPPHRAGLAHFHEHMLFLGTEKYPREEEYEEFLGRNGGMSNAYTDMEDTNYYFNVAPLDHDNDDDDDDDDQETADVEAGATEKVKRGTSAALAGALDRFAQFFISPLFDESMLERELRAVNSEYLNGRTADNWRNYQMLKQGASKDHPFSKFGCGNYNTLTNGGDPSVKNQNDGNSSGEETANESATPVAFGGGSSPREDLVKFWTDKYHAGNLRLCVVGRASLDDLQRTVEQTFGGVRPPPPGFVANGIMDRIRAGKLQLPSPGESHPKDEHGEFVFQTEHSTYGPSVAFGREQLGLIREVVPLVESRSLKIFSAVPPTDDPVLRESRPFRVLSHLVGHESPGSLHHLLMEEGWINSLSSGIGISCSDFCLTSISINLTPKGMRQRDQVLAKTWQWLALIKDSVTNDPHGLIEEYHKELKTITDISFKFREMGDPTDFCSRAAEKLFDYEPHKVLIGSSESGEYDEEVARAFLQRLTPQNSLIVVTGPDVEEGQDDLDSSARDGEWQIEERYGGKYRQVRMSDSLVERWNHPTDIDSRLSLPGLNEFIPEDVSLRCDDPESLETFDPDVDYRKEPPKLIVDNPKLRMWHKMDRTFRVPKTSIRLQLNSPEVYRSPRAITLNRLFQKVLTDDLNSYVYDATVAGCNYRVSCVPSAYRFSVSGYSEKLPHLLDVVTARIASLIQEMKEGDEAHPALAEIFNKAKDNLLRQTKNYIYDSPYETGSYNMRMLMEAPVWHISDYIAEMEGEYADNEPLTMKECAEVAEKCLFGRSKAVSLCIGNIDEKQSKEIAELIESHFLKSRPLADDENPRFRSLRLPTKSEAIQIYDESVAAREVPIIYEALAHSESEENNAVEVVMQTASSFELGYEGLAIQELIGHMAYNSAFNQLRTKEQLGYIVSAFTKKITGGGNAFCVLVQSSNTLPPGVEERCLRWVEQFRKEIENMPEERIAMEAQAVRANILEKDIKLAEEISSVWGEILATVPHTDHYKNPVFDRLERFADVLTLDGDSIDNGSSIRSAADLKKRVLDFYDKYFLPSSPERKIVSSRVYNRKAKDIFDENVGKPGFISSYDDARKLKQHLSSFPTAPYW
ncbi:hypothetical protein ACHAXS_009237 [Conticribra weissflogii]